MFKQPRLIIQLEFNRSIVEQINSADIAKVISIGRHEDCDWQIPPTDRTASNRHAELFVKRGRIWLRDCGSHNGVYYKGSKIKERVLAPGDRFGIGDARLIVVEDRSKTVNAKKFHRLEQLNGSRRGRMIELREPEYIIGSDPLQAQIVCEEQLVSRRHAMLSIHEDGSCWIVNLESRNGLQINQMQLSKNSRTGRMLMDNDVISCANIDFRFYDKDVVNVKSHFWLKMVTAVVTAILCVSAYLLWQGSRSSAKTYIDEARQMAKAVKYVDRTPAQVNAQFDYALSVLAQARNARHYDVYQKTAASLEKSIEGWKSTWTAWESVKRQLVECRWVPANTELLPLLASKNLWNCNAESIAAEMEARQTALLLENMLAARAAFRDRDYSLEGLQTRLAALKENVSDIQKDNFDYLHTLCEYSRSLLNECDYALSFRMQVNKLVDGFQRIEQVAAVLDNFEKKQNELAEHLRADVIEEPRTEENESQPPPDEGEGEVAAVQTEEIRRPLQLDAEDRRRINEAAVTLLRSYLEPLKGIKKAYDEFLDNINHAAAFEFLQVTPTLASLPSPDECGVSQVFTLRRNDLAAENRRLLENVKQLRIWVETLRNKYGIYVDGKAPEQPPEFPILENKNFAYAEATWRNVLACDCFSSPPELWVRRRSAPIGDYDKLLGIEPFLDFLKMISPDAPEPFDLGSLDDMNFKPVLPSLRQAYGDLLMFIHFLDTPVFEPLLANQAMADKSYCPQLWVKVRGLLREWKGQVGVWMEKSHQAEKKGLVRDALIYGGAALILAEDPVLNYPGEYDDRMRKLLRENFAAVNGEESRPRRPEELVMGYRSILAIGLPGYHIVNQAFLDLASLQEKEIEE